MAGRRSENPRQDAVAVLQMHREGRHEEALARAADLATNNRSSAVACNLAGDLNLKAYFRNRQRNPELALKHANSAVEHYNLAMNASPNCIETIAAFGEALSASKQHDRAAAKFRWAKSISSPADPANQHAAFDTRGLSTKKERIAKAKDRLQRAVDINTNASCEEEVLKVLDIMARQGLDAAGRAVVNVGYRFPLSARAQLLRAHVMLQLSNSLLQEIDRRWILIVALHIISEAALTFKNSLVIALSHGEVLAILRKYDAAEKECYRALRIDKPRDPVGHDIPPGSVGGEEYADRVCFVKEQIHALLKRVVSAAVHDFSLMTREQQEDILSVRVNTLYEHFKGIDPSLANSILDAQLFIKRQSRWDFWICPYPTCTNPKFHTSQALWVHLSTSFEHNEDFQKSFHSVLGNAETCGNESKGPSSFDVISFSGDSHQQETFCFTQIHDLFDQMVLCPSGATEILPTAEMQRKIQREGAEVLDSIKEYLRTSADLFSNEVWHLYKTWFQFS
ncbi:hypothetical protein E2562_036036 [Oryza meyeriana var. granulata]|uniref:DUF629 domain-containing protein n=1 Tax=Oryza meyeriana var. granulata TaxID=110450 RepID=A0A6G1CX27_9ORYZ|nr:hypothetical protein E2562_036036 [Oryza meyeriana var. granulata]